MCERLKTALDVTKSHPSRSNLTKTEVLMLFEKVCEDNQKMGDRMTELEKRITSVENKVDGLDDKLNKVLSIIDKPTIWNSVKEVLSNKTFLYILISLICWAFGVSVGEVGTFLFKG